VDYLVTERKRYIEAPLLCIIETKKDDFEQGLAQCLVEMQACQWKNQQADRPIAHRPINILGIVTNGATWQFYKLTAAGLVYETPAYSLGDQDLLLGRLRYIFQLCEDALSASIATNTITNPGNAA
jgi:hypothetical protein